MTGLRHTRLPVPLLSLALLLTGCAMSGEDGGGGDARPAGFDAIGPDETVRAIGTEPFWAVTLQGTQARFSEPDAPDGRVLEVRRFTGNSGLGFSGMLDGMTFDLLVTAGECSDGMSDRRYPFTATLRLGARLLEGCASTDQSPPQSDSTAGPSAPP